MRAPVAVGRKVGVIVQLAPAASVFGETGQVLACEKWLASAPVMVMPVMVNGPVPEFVNVTAGDAALESPTLTPPKGTLAAERVTAG